MKKVSLSPDEIYILSDILNRVYEHSHFDADVEMYGTDDGLMVTFLPADFSLFVDILKKLQSY